MNEQYTIQTAPRFRIFLFIILAICILACSITLINWIVDQINLASNGQPDFNELAQDELKNGLFVTGTVKCAYGPYAIDDLNKYTKEPDITDDYIYLVPIFSEDGFVEYFISYETSIDGSEMYDLSSYFAGETDEYKPYYIEHARMKNMERDLRWIVQSWVQEEVYYEGGSFIDYCIENNMLDTTDNDEILSKFVPFVLMKQHGAGISLDTFFQFGAIGLICVGLLLIIRSVHKSRLKQMFEAMQAKYDGDDMPMQ